MKYQALKRVLEMLLRAPMVLQVIRLCLGPNSKAFIPALIHSFTHKLLFRTHYVSVTVQDKYYMAPPFAELRACGKDR